MPPVSFYGAKKSSESVPSDNGRTQRNRKKPLKYHEDLQQQTPDWTRLIHSSSINLCTDLLRKKFDNDTNKKTASLQQTFNFVGLLEKLQLCRTVQ